MFTKRIHHLVTGLVLLAAYADQARAATVTWDGGAGTTSWHDAANWSANSIPGPADDVVINVAGSLTVVHSSGDSNIQSLMCAETLLIQGGTIIPTAASTVSGVLHLNSAANAGIAGTGDITVSGHMEWTLGRMSDSGKTIIAPGATLHISGGNPTKILRRTLENNGTANWNDSAQTLINNATFINNGVLILDNVTPVTIDAGTGFTGLIQNNGSCIKTGPGTVTISSTASILAFNNAGSLDVQEGTLWLKGGGAHSGSFETSGGNASTLLLGGSHLMDAASSVAGNGLFEVKSGSTAFGGNVDLTDSASVTLQTGTTSTFSGSVVFPPSGTIIKGTVDLGALDVAVGDIYLDGTLKGTGVFTITGPTTINGAMEGSGRTVVADSAEVTILALWLRREFENKGLAKWYSGGQFIDGTFINNGTVQFPETLNDQLLDIDGWAGTNEFTNNGLIEMWKLDTVQFRPNGAATFTFNNHGTIHVGAGTLRISRGTHTGAFIIDPPSPDPGPYLEFVGDTHLTATSTIDCQSELGVDSLQGVFLAEGEITVGPDGLLAVRRGAAVFGGVLNVFGMFELSDTTTESPVTFQGSPDFSSSPSVKWRGQGTVIVDLPELHIPSLELEIRDLVVQGDLIIDQDMFWSDADISGPGRVVVAPGAAMFAQGAFSTISGTVTNYGSLEIIAYRLFFDGGSIVNEEGGNMTMEFGSPSRFESVGEPGSIVNRGTCELLEGQSIVFSGVALVNEGVATIETGTVDLLGGCSGDGTMNVQPNATVTLRSACAVGDINVGGRINVWPQEELNVSGTFQMLPTGRIALAFPSMDGPWVIHQGDAILDGTLQYGYSGTAVAVVGQVVPIFDGGTVVGRFATVMQPSWINGRFLCTTYEKDAVSALCNRKGDVTGDNMINIDDYTAVVLSWGDCAEPCPANADCAGEVDIDDLTMVILNWGG